MDFDQTICPSCSTNVSLSSYFCQNCGRKLRERPLSTSVFKQIRIYLVSFLAPPSGLWYGFSYLRQEDDRAKAVGIVAILLTLISVLITLIFIINLLNSVTQILSGPAGQSSVNTSLNNSGLEKMLNNQLKQYKELGL